MKEMRRGIDVRDIDRGRAASGINDGWTIDGGCLAEIPVCDFYSI
jgi:hypothetical protein